MGLKTKQRTRLAVVAAALAVAAPLGIAHASRTLKTNPPLITNAATFSSQLVALHNQLRGYHYEGSDTTTPMTWDASLAAGAQSWANECTFQHSVSGGKYGENLYTADPMGTQAEAVAGAMEAWYNEVTSYNFNQPGWNPNAGHFTQVVWKGSTAVGCGAADCTGFHTGALPAYVVCRYSPAGNMDTTAAFKANVLPCGSLTAPDGGCKAVSLAGAPKMMG